MEDVFICTKCAAYIKGMNDIDKSIQTLTLFDILSPHTTSFIHSCIPSDELYGIVVFCEKKCSTAWSENECICLESTLIRVIKYKSRGYQIDNIPEFSLVKQLNL